MKTADRLVARLREEAAPRFVIPDGATLERTRAGYWQRKGGAFSWFVNIGHGTTVGSVWTATQLLKCREPWMIYRQRDTGDIIVEMDPFDRERLSRTS